jgi:hypothetical protein
VALDGVLFWLLDSKITDFDFGDEVLRTSLLPNDFNLHHISLMIAVLTYTRNRIPDRGVRGSSYLVVG